MLHGFASTLLHWVDSYGLWGAFWLMVIENLGVPFPTEAGFVIAVREIRTGSISYPFAVLVITAGHMLGSTVSYAVGRLGSERLEKWMSRAERWERAHVKLREWYSRYGSLTVFIARLIGYVRPYSSLVAGIAEVPFVPFFIWSLVGTVLIVIASLACTDLFARVWMGYPQFHPLMTIGLSIGCLALLWTALWRAAQRRRNSASVQRMKPDYAEKPDDSLAS